MNFGCDFAYFQTEVPRQIQEAIMMDAGQNVLLTRFFHNKPLFYLVNFCRCYLGFFNLLYIIALSWGYKLFLRRRGVLKK
jgi:hypothetical protein